MEFEYNTQKPRLLLMEYGRNIQKIVDYISKVEDRAKRTQLAHTLIHLMRQLNPSVKENHDNPQRIWDHLFIMSDFKLDVDAPYPMPDRSILHVKPMKMEYTQKELKFKHYGRNIEILVKNAAAIQDPQEQKAAFIRIVRLMRSFYESWNRDLTSLETILQDIKVLTDNQIDLIEEFKQNPKMFDNNPYAPTTNAYAQQQSSGNPKTHYDKKKKKKKK